MFTRRKLFAVRSLPLSQDLAVTAVTARSVNTPLLRF
jgi:hypothetical protein